MRWTHCWHTETSPDCRMPQTAGYARARSFMLHCNLPSGQSRLQHQQAFRAQCPCCCHPEHDIVINMMPAHYKRQHNEMGHKSGGLNGRESAERAAQKG